MKRILFLAVLFLALSVSCKKSDPHDAGKQAQIDEQLIKDFIAANNIEATRDPSGLYYSVVRSGSGSIDYNNSTIKYKGRLLNGEIFDEGSFIGRDLPFDRLIQGWQIGIQKIKAGGKIRLIIPSSLAYGPQSNPGIPANSVLDFDVELLNAY